MYFSITGSSINQSESRTWTNRHRLTWEFCAAAHLQLFSLWWRDLLCTLPFRKRELVLMPWNSLYAHLFYFSFAPPPDEWLSVASQINSPLSNTGSLDSLWMCVCARACPILYPYAMMCKPIHKHASAFGLASMSKYNYSHKNKWIRLVTVHLLCLNTTVINRDPSPPQQHYFLSPSQRQPDRLEAL